MVWPYLMSQQCGKLKLNAKVVAIDTASNWEEVAEPATVAMMGSPPCGKETDVTALRTRLVGRESLTQDREGELVWRD